uniref:Uncharacterized protein n=1 Tax=Pandinus cavimanus TaxID=217261 RepID=H2CYP5_PANCV|nr:hypothetical protein [Pandinus cavimanus]
MKKLKDFARNNIVLLVMVPSMIALHYIWSKLQDIEAFVPKEQKKDFPLKKMYSLVFGASSKDTGKKDS